MKVPSEPLVRQGREVRAKSYAAGVFAASFSASRLSDSLACSLSLRCPPPETERSPMTTLDREGHR